MDIDEVGHISGFIYDEQEGCWTPEPETLRLLAKRRSRKLRRNRYADAPSMEDRRCRRGHWLIAANLYVTPKGKIRCRQCRTNARWAKCALTLGVD